MAPRKTTTPAEDEAAPARIVNRTEFNKASSQRDHGGGPPKENEPQQGRPNDLGSFEAPHPLGGNSTLAERRAARLGAESKRVDNPETK